MSGAAFALACNNSGWGTGEASTDPGDLRTPNINKRFFRLKSSNYHHFPLSKRLNSRVAFTIDYTFRVGTRGLKVVDSIVFESDQRTIIEKDYGCNVYAEKALYERPSVGAGQASIHPGAVG